MTTKTKIFLLGVLPFALILIVDRLTKQWAMGLSDQIEIAFLKFELVLNHGIMLGHLSHLPINVKTTLLTTLGAIILGSYVIFMLVVPISSKWLRLGPTFLVAGIIGNVLDRFLGEAVIDFVGIPYGTEKFLYLNFADIFQWFGYLFIILGIKQDSTYYWPKNEWRNKILINKRFQLRCGFLLGVLNFLVGFVFIIFGFAFFKQSSENHFESYYFISGFSILLFLSFLGFIIGVVLSHRIAGPIHALEKYIDESLEGKEGPFILRKSDEFKELQEAFSKFNAKLKDSNKAQ